MAECAAKPGRLDDARRERKVSIQNPQIDDTDENWRKYKARQKLHTDNTQYVVAKVGLGAEIYGNSFSARSKFMLYARKFEERLAEANQSQSGRGVLVFCGTGWEWRLSEVEDFADFYCAGKHRPDDPFAKMEAEEIQRESIMLKRNIDAFGFVKRSVLKVTEDQFVPEVRGPLCTC